MSSEDLTTQPTKNCPPPIVMIADVGLRHEQLLMSDFVTWLNIPGMQESTDLLFARGDRVHIWWTLHIPSRYWRMFLLHLNVSRIVSAWTRSSFLLDLSGWTECRTLGSGGVRWTAHELLRPWDFDVYRYVHAFFDDEWPHSSFCGGTAVYGACAVVGNTWCGSTTPYRVRVIFT